MTEHEKEELVKSCWNLAKKLVNEFYSKWKWTGRGWDEWESAAMYGLALAADRFDPTRGVKFSTFAWNGIEKQLLSELRKTLPVRRKPYREFKRCLKAIRELFAEEVRSPSLEQIAEKADLSYTKARDIVQRPGGGPGYQPVQIKPCHSEIQEGRVGPSEDVRHPINWDTSRLTEKQKDIFNRKYLQGETFVKIAEDYGVSKQRVEQIAKEKILPQIKAEWNGVEFSNRNESVRNRRKG